jgi:DNA invertase Pin-like site-specific DNA recombinase
MEYFVYARKSTESEEKQVLSIPAQLRELDEYAQKWNLKIVDTMSEAKSARTPNKREEFSRMLNRIQNGECNRILVWQTNRLSRNPQEAGILMQLLSDGIIEEIRTPLSSVTTENSNDILLGVEFGSHSQFSKDLSRSTKRGFREKILRGEYPTFAPPFYLNVGTIKGSKNIIPDERIRHYYVELVDKVIRERLRSNNCFKILKEWGVISKFGRYYSRNTVTRLLRNPVYYGEMKRYDRDEFVPGSWEPLITKERWLELQDVLDRRSKPYQTKHNHPYRRLIKCSHCGYSIVGYTKIKDSGKKYTYYSCSMRGGHCGNPSLTIDDLELQLFNIISAIKLTEEEKEKVKQEVFSRLESEINHKQNTTGNVEAEINKLDENEKELFTMRMNKEITPEEYTMAKTDIKEKKNKLEELRGDAFYNLEDIKLKLELFIDKCFNLQELFTNAIPDERTLLLGEVCEDLILDNKQIGWNYRKGYRSMANQEFLSESFNWGGDFYTA